MFVHCAIEAHAVFEVVVAGAVWYWLDVHGVTGMHVVSDVVVAAAVWYWLNVHVVMGLQTVLLVAVAACDVNAMRRKEMMVSRKDHTWKQHLKTDDKKRQPHGFIKYMRECVIVANVIVRSNVGAIGSAMRSPQVNTVNQATN